MHIKPITKGVPMHAQSVLTITDTINAILSTLTGIIRISGDLEDKKADGGAN